MGKPAAWREVRLVIVFGFVGDSPSGTDCRGGAGDRVRGGLAGVTCAALAAAAHGHVAALPHSAALAFLILIGGLVGVAVGSGAGRGRLRLLALLLAGQLVEHLALTMASEPGRMSSLPMHSGCQGPMMLVAHVLAAGLCAVLIAAAERVYSTVSDVVRVLCALLQPVWPTEPAGCRPRSASAPRYILLWGAISRRGPPVAFFAAA